MIGVAHPEKYLSTKDVHVSGLSAHVLVEISFTSNMLSRTMWVLSKEKKRTVFGL